MLQTKIALAEADGTYAFKKKYREFSSVNEVTYEPEGTAWISSPA